MLNRRNILWCTGVIALSVRGVFAALVLQSAFRAYHLVPGLDMMTLLRFSEWTLPEVQPFFTLQRLMLYLLWAANKQQHIVAAAFLVQALSGVLGAIALADLALMLSGKRKTSLCCGIFYALYLPFLVYEFSILQETLAVNMLIFAVWSVFRMRKKRFSLFSSCFAGALWALTFTGRPTAVFFGMAVFVGILIYAKRKHRLLKTIPFFATLAIVLAGCATFNYLNHWKFSPFYSVLSYTLKYNSEESVQAGKSGETSLIRSTLQAAARVPKLYSIQELPENQNIYFWRLKLPDLQILPGPELLLSLTVFGMAVLLLCCSWRRKEMLLWYPLLLLSLPLCAREAIGRYRLLLCPCFILISCFSFYLLYRLGNRKKRYICAVAAAGISAAAIFAGAPESNGIRANDYLSWATACEKTYGHCDETLDAFLDLWKFTQYKSVTAFCALTRQALLCKRHDVAATVIQQAKLQSSIPQSVPWYFTGLIFVDKNEPENVLSSFRNINVHELPANLQPHYTAILRETVRILNEQHKRRLHKLK